MKPFSIGIMADSLKLPFEESIRKAAEMGADGIQIYATSGEMSPEALSASKRKELFRMIRDNGLVVSALCGDLGGHGFAIAEANAERIEKSKRIIDLALDWDCRVVTTHIGTVPDTVDATYETMQKACHALGAYAESVGAHFAVETGPEPAAVLGKFLDSLGNKGVGVNYDPANLVMVTHDDPVTGVYTLKDYIVHTHAKDGVHLSDCDRFAVYNAFAEADIAGFDFGKHFNEVPLGRGEIDWPSYLSALEEIGYCGFLTVEREVGENPEADIAMAVEFLKKQID